MKRKTFFPPLFLFPLFIIPSACKYYSYGLEEFFYRENTLDKRIDTLTELNEKAREQQEFNQKYGRN